MKKPVRKAGAMGPGREEKSRALIRASFNFDTEEVNRRVKGQKMLGGKDRKVLEKAHSLVDRGVKLREEAARIRDTGARMAKDQALQKAQRDNKKKGK
jgi:hypothetical protein